MEGKAGNGRRASASGCDRSRPRKIRAGFVAGLLGLLAVPATGWSAPAVAPAAVDPAAIDRAVDDAIARYRLPGIAVGVVEDGQVAHVRTAGEAVAGSGQPVTPDTIFKIASNSKAMTASVLARLVDAGKLRWDDPVAKHLPAFRMHDPWVTQHMQVRDLLIHNSGLPEGGGDLMLWPEPNRFTRADIIAGLGHIKPAYSFRSGYAYDNLLYVVAGEVAAAAGGAPYEDLVRREIFAPLGLDRCRVGKFDLEEVGNVAQPHAWREGRAVVTNADEARVPAITSAAAGGIRCSLGDMLDWARNWLAPDAAQQAWLSPAQRAEMWKIRTPMPVGQRRRDWDDTHVYGYGYGFRMADVDGEWTVSHTGTLSGMYSMMMLLPDQRSGFVMLINGNADEARTVLGEVLLKQFTAPESKPTVAGYAARIAAEPEGADEASRPDTSARAPAAKAELAQRLGVWRDPWFGEVALCARGDGVRWESDKSPMLRGNVVRVGRRYLVDWDDDDLEAWLDFAGEGAGAAMTMAKTDPEGDFSYDYEDLRFTRVRDCTDTTVSAATTPAEADLVDIATLVPDIALDMRYAGSDNFVGTPVEGYRAPKCYLRTAAAKALAGVEAELRKDDLRLKLFDCYRPARAVAHFVRWAADLDDQRTKPVHYPDLDKRLLLGDYVASVSGHSRGFTVDLTLQRCDGDRCTPLDMGTAFDFFDPRANTDSPDATRAQRANRDRLRDAMRAGGFANYPMEWWHFTLDPMPKPAPLHDVPVE